MIQLSRIEETALRRLSWGPQVVSSSNRTLCGLADRGLIFAGAELGDDRTWSLTPAGLEAAGLASEPDPAFEQAVVDHLNRALGHPDRVIESQAA